MNSLHIVTESHTVTENLVRSREVVFAIPALAVCLGVALAGGANLIGNASPVFGQELAVEDSKGLSKLDEATDLKLSAQTPDQLAEVVALCEQAKKLGLDDFEVELANQLLASAAFERAEMMTKAMMRSQQMTPQMVQKIRAEVLNDCKKATDADPSFVPAMMLLARMYAVGNDRDDAMNAAQKVVDLETATDDEKSDAFVLIASMKDAYGDKLEYLIQAIEANPKNQAAWQARVAILMEMQDFEQARTVLDELLTNEPDNRFAIMAATESLLALDKQEEAREMLSSKIASMPPEETLEFRKARADILFKQEMNEEALEDIDLVLSEAPDDMGSLLLRAQIHLAMDDADAAKQDVDSVLEKFPGSVGGIILRSLVSAQQERYEDAIRDMEILVREDPANTGWLLQLASYYQLADQPQRCIQACDEVLQVDAQNWRALRTRGDARLSTGEHKEAIEDYELALSALEATPDSSTDMDADRSGLLNNLAWVLATSPTDDLRDGERSIQLGTEACELTEFNAPHILSTLAAGYAEAGNFEKAIEYAEKSVSTGKEQGHDQLDQLEQELETYKKGEPWREKQEAEEKLVIPSGGIDA